MSGESRDKIHRCLGLRRDAFAAFCTLSHNIWNIFANIIGIVKNCQRFLARRSSLAVSLLTPTVFLQQQREICYRYFSMTRKITAKNILIQNLNKKYP